VINPSTPRPAPMSGGAVTRRNFLSRTAALAGGVATGALVPSPAWATPVDLRDSKIITPVKNQALCNACTAFAVVATVEGTYNKQQSYTTPDKWVNLSEAQLFFAAGPKDACGTSHWWPRGALEYCKTVGLAREDAGEFARTSNLSPPTPELIKIATYPSLLRHTLVKTQDKMKSHINTTGPVVAVMVQYEDFQTWGNDWARANPGMPNPGVYSPGLKPGRIVGGHVLSIVGYDDGSNPKSWLCKNSWSASWNGDGYVWIAQGLGNNVESYVDCIDVWGITLP